jgi:hypothetical protein
MLLGAYSNAFCHAMMHASQWSLGSRGAIDQPTAIGLRLELLRTLQRSEADLVQKLLTVRKFGVGAALHSTCIQYHFLCHRELVHLINPV